MLKIIMITMFVVMKPLIQASTETELREQNMLLRTQNEQLVKSMQAMEKRITHLESEIKHGAPVRRQYDGPWTFSYRIDHKVQTFNRNGPIVFPKKITDLGGGYDNNTGIYTVPRAGVYILSCSLLADGNSTSNPKLHASIIVDGTPIAKVFAYGDSNSNGNGSHRDQGSSTVFVELKQGSGVWVKVTDDDHVTVGGGKYSMFSGYLLWEY